jgi:hypothetical protein
MIVYHKNKEIDREQWDNCINNTDNAKPYAYSWYLDIMSPGWEALVDDDYDSVFPIPSYMKFGLQYASTPPFLQQLGAFSPDKPDYQAIVEFLDYMPEIYKLTDICIGQKITYPGYKVTEKSNFELSLSSSYEKLSENFTKDCRRYITNNSRKKYDLTGTVSPEELVELYATNRLSNTKGVKARTYERLLNLMNYCISKQTGRIIGVRTARKKLIYGIFLITLHKSVTIILETNTPASLTKHIGHFVVNEIIRDNASSAVVLDFAGTSDMIAVAMGKSFGAARVPYYRIYRNRLFWPSRLMNICLAF